MSSLTNAKSYRIWIPLIWGMLVLMVVAMAVAAVAGVPMATLLPQGALVLLLCLAALWKFHAARRGVVQADQQSEAILSGECLAHWHYTPQEWAAYADRAYARTKPVIARKLRILAPVIVACVALPFVASGALSGPAPWPAVLSLVMLVVATGAIYFVYSIPSLGRSRLLRSKPEARIGPNGVLQIGQYSPWSIAGRKLASVTLDPTPANTTRASDIVFNILIGATNVQVYTPVPQGQERQAEEIVQRLSQPQPTLDQATRA